MASRMIEFRQLRRRVPRSSREVRRIHRPGAGVRRTLRQIADALRKTAGRLQHRADYPADHCADQRTEAAPHVALVVVHDHGTRRRRRRMVHDHGTRRRRRVAHDRHRTMMRGAMRRGAVLRMAWRRRTLGDGRPTVISRPMTAAGRGKSSSAERDARETCNQKLVYVVVHSTPLSTF